jgi:hypothetical protein
LAVPRTSSAKEAASPQCYRESNTTSGPSIPRLFTRAEALALLKIGETTLFWLQRTGKLKATRIGSRVLFNSTEITRIAAHGATLTGAEKEAAAKRDANTNPSIQRAEFVSCASHRRGRPRKAFDVQDNTQ